MAWGGKNGEAGPARGSGSLSFIGNEVTITGNVQASGDMHVDGTIDGDLACGTLTLGESGRVKGNISAERATLAGTVEGTVSAGELIVEKAARISGDVSYANISVEAGAKIDGRLSQRGATSSGDLKLVATGD
jgi:cytoskeletal protein CcmA (bactofilin family)